jgi:hypothetical protein
MKKSVALLAMLVILPSVASAQRGERRPSLPSVTANGEAVITVEPDQAQIDIGVVTQARNAPEAAKENAEKLARVMSEVKKLLGKGDEIKTANYSLSPNYRYPQGGKPEIVGYTATNVLHIKPAAWKTSASYRRRHAVGREYDSTPGLYPQGRTQRPTPSVASRVDKGQSQSRGNGQCPRPQNRQGPLRYRR